MSETTVFACANNIGNAQTLQNARSGKSDFCETTVLACANEIGNAQTLQNTWFDKSDFCETTVFACANEIGNAQTLQNTRFRKSDFCETTVFACANEIGNAQILQNTRFGKSDFCETTVFACANENDIAPNLVIPCVLMLSKSKIVQKGLFSSHFCGFGGPAKSLQVQIPFSLTAADPPGSLSDDGSGGGFWGALSLGRFWIQIGIKFRPKLVSEDLLKRYKDNVDFRTLF